MKRANPNVVQATFLERADGRHDVTQVKAVVRFHDEGDYLTAFVERLARVRFRCIDLEAALSTAHGWRRKLLGFRLRCAQRKADARERAKALAVERLRAIAKTSAQIAVGDANRSFRPMSQEEVPDLLDAVRCAKAVWLYVFGPNELLADEFSLIGRVV